MPTPTKASPLTTPLMDDLTDMLIEWRRTLTSSNLSPETLRNYLGCTGRMLDFLKANGMPHAADTVKREHLEHFINSLLLRVSDATAAKHYRAMKIFFNFLVDDDVIMVNPMARMKPPKISEKEVPVIPTEDVKKLLATCKTKTFYDLRDLALVTLMFDSGARVGEIVGMDLNDYDPESRSVKVIGKGKRPRKLHTGRNSIDALRRYLRIRRTHQLAGTSDAFWLGRYEPLKRPGIAQMLDRRCEEAGIAHIHPHQFRHTFAHNWQAMGGSENDLMSLTGWRSREMVTRYARSAASVRAHAAHETLSPADRLL